MNSDENGLDVYHLTDEESINLKKNRKNSTLLEKYDKFNSDDEIFINKSQESSRWLADIPKKPKLSYDSEEENIITELDVNTELEFKDKNFDETKSNKKVKEIKNENNFLKSLPTIQDSDLNLNKLNEQLPIFLNKNILSLEQLDELNTKKNEKKFVLDDIDLSILAKHLINENDSNLIEPDLEWTWESLVTETNNFKNN